MSMRRWLAVAAVTAAAFSCVMAWAAALAGSAGAATLSRFPAAPQVARATRTLASTVLQGGAARFRTVDVPGATATVVDGVNDFGVLVGTYSTSATNDFGFIEAREHRIKLNFPGTSGVTSAEGINDRGTTVGFYTDAAGTYHGWVRSANGKFYRLDDPSAASGSGLGTLPFGINDAGLIVGYFVGKDNAAHAFIYRPKSGFTTVDAPGADHFTSFVSINDAGVISGTYVDAQGVYHGFAYSHGTFFDFEAPGAGTGSGQGTIAEGISRKGVIDGTTFNASNASLGWLLSDWQFSPLNDPLAGTGPGLGTQPYGINQRGDEACGAYLDASGTVHGFVATLPG